MSSLGGSTAGGAAGGSSAAGVMASTSSAAPDGGTLGTGPAGGAGAAPTDGGASRLGATATATAPQPDGAATPLGRLVAGPLPVHPHLDDPTGGHLDAYAVVDHTHPSSTSGYWTFSTNPAMTDPGAGHVRVDTGVVGTATVVALSTTTQPGTALPPVAGTMGPGDSLYLQDRDDNTRWARYDVTADATKSPTYGTIPVLVTAASGTNVANNAVVELVFSLSAGGGGGAGGVSPHAHADSATGGLVDYARLVVAATPPAAPTTPSDAFWLNPGEEA